MRSVTSSLFIISMFFSVVAVANYGYLYLERPNESFEDIHVELMNRTMGTIFVILGILKIPNLKGFANIFSKYDILARQSILYGYTYPFLEITLGASFFMKEYRDYAHKTTIALMILGLIGVGSTMYTGTPMRCGCLGSLFHVPLSYVTISENLLMIGMSLYLQSQ